MRLQAQKMGSIKAVKRSLTKGGGEGKVWIKNIPADGLTVRFLTEPDDWFGYSEYWTGEGYCPMAEGEILPDDAKATFRYLAVAVDVDSDRVVPVKLPKTVANPLVHKYEKFGTIKDRNYDLEKHGEGLATTYDVTPDSPSAFNDEKHDLIDLEKVLIDARRDALGESDLESDDDSFTDDDIDVDDEPTQEIPVAGTDDGPTDYEDDVYEMLFPGDEYRSDYTKAELETCTTDDLDILIEEHWGIDSEDGWGRPQKVAAIMEAQVDDSDDGDAPLDESQLKGMSIKDLRKVAEDIGLDHDGLSKPNLLAAIVDAQER